VPIGLSFERIPPGRRIGPHSHRAETILYLAAGELVFEHGADLEHHVVVRPGDVLYEAVGADHLVRNDGPIDALALIASSDPDERDRGPRLAGWIRGEEPVRRWVDGRVREDGGVARRLIARGGDFGSPSFSVSEIQLSPGMTGEWHRHIGAEHVIVVLEGRGEIVVEDVTETLEPLTGIRVEPGAVHRVAATGRGGLRYVLIGSPGLDPERDRTAAPAPERQLDG
jgi:quercetin dioxygenase-like cupin family protein